MARIKGATRPSRAERRRTKRRAARKLERRIEREKERKKKKSPIFSRVAEVQEAVPRRGAPKPTRILDPKTGKIEKIEIVEKPRPEVEEIGKIIRAEEPVISTAEFPVLTLAGRVDPFVDVTPGDYRYTEAEERALIAQYSGIPVSAVTPEMLERFREFGRKAEPSLPSIEPRFELRTTTEPFGVIKEGETGYVGGRGPAAIWEEIEVIPGEKVIPSQLKLYYDPEAKKAVPKFEFFDIPKTPSVKYAVKPTEPIDMSKFEIHKPDLLRPVGLGQVPSITYGPYKPDPFALKSAAEKQEIEFDLMYKGQKQALKEFPIVSDLPGGKEFLERYADVAYPETAKAGYAQVREALRFDVEKKAREGLVFAPGYTPEGKFTFFGLVEHVEPFTTFLEARQQHTPETLAAFENVQRGLTFGASGVQYLTSALATTAVELGLGAVQVAKGMPMAIPTTIKFHAGEYVTPSELDVTQQTFAAALDVSVSALAYTVTSAALKGIEKIGFKIPKGFRIAETQYRTATGVLTKQPSLFFKTPLPKWIIGQTIKVGRPGAIAAISSGVGLHAYATTGDVKKAIAAAGATALLIPASDIALRRLGKIESKYNIFRETQKFMSKDEAQAKFTPLEYRQLYKETAIWAKANKAAAQALGVIPKTQFIGTITSGKTPLGLRYAADITKIRFGVGFKIRGAVGLLGRQIGYGFRIGYERPPKVIAPVGEVPTEAFRMFEPVKPIKEYKPEKYFKKAQLEAVRVPSPIELRAIVPTIFPAITGRAPPVQPQTVIQTEIVRVLGQGQRQVTQQIQKVGQTSIPAVRQVEMQKVKHPEIKKLRQVEIEKIRQVPVQALRVTELQKIRQTEIQKLRQIQLQKIRTPEEKIPPILPPILPGLDDIGKPKKIKGITPKKLKRRYVPTVEARLADFRGPRPKGLGKERFLTGLERRPIAPKAKPKKRKKIGLEKRAGIFLGKIGLTKRKKKRGKR